jgi:hypothetical protein
MGVADQAVLAVLMRWAAFILALLPMPALAQPVPPLEVINQARAAREIPPDDAKDFPYGPTRWLWVGGGMQPGPVAKPGTRQLTGDITAPKVAAFPCAIRLILADDGEPVVFSGIPPGMILPLRVKRLLATGTTCAGIVGLW